jgi:hypothetical protein
MYVRKERGGGAYVVVMMVMRNERRRRVPQISRANFQSEFLNNSNSPESTP